MKRGILIFALLLALVFLSAYLYFQFTDFKIFKKTVTGEAITGNASSASIAVSITVAEEETPSGGGGGGGGGGGRLAASLNQTTFEVEPEIFKVLIKKGEIFKSSIKIKNIENSAQSFTIKPVALDDFVILSETEFTLEPQEEKEIIIFFSGPVDIREDTYTGNLKISTRLSSVEIPVIIGIKSRVSIFDITLHIPEKYKDLKPGDDLLFQINLYNLGETGKVDVQINYLVKDLYGNTITEDNAVVGVETQASFSRIIYLPDNLADGQYVAIANVRYLSSVGTASDIFYINKARGIRGYLTIILGILVFMIGVFLIISHFNKRAKEIPKIYSKEVDKIEEKIKRGIIKTSEASEKLRSQLSLLDKAYGKGYISKEAYGRGKDKINKVRENLKRRLL